MLNTAITHRGKSMAAMQNPLFTPNMDEQEGLIRAYMRHVSTEWQEKARIPRAQVIHFALNHWLSSGDMGGIRDWYLAVEASDTTARLDNPGIKRGVYFTAGMHEKSQQLGALIQGQADLKRIVSTGGDFNRRLVIALAFERLTRIIHEQYPDLQPEQ